MPKIFTESGVDVVRTVRNYESSWSFYGNLAGASVEYGKAIEGFDAANDELVISDQLNFIGLNEYFKDNDGFFNERKKVVGAGTIPVGVDSNITTTRNVETYVLQAELNESVFLSDFTQASVNAVSLSAWFGQKIKFRAYKIYASYSKVDVPGPYIGDPDTEAYYRDGGTLVLVSGNGVDTPRVYEWQGPFDPVDIEFTTYADYDLSAKDVAMPVVTTTVTIGPGKLCLESGIVMKQVSPGQDS
jgi:hypothetical protein